LTLLEPQGFWFVPRYYNPLFAALWYFFGIILHILPSFVAIGSILWNSVHNTLCNLYCSISRFSLNVKSYENSILLHLN